LIGSSNFVLSFLFDDFNDLADNLFEFFMADSAVSVRVDGSDEVVDVRKAGFFHVEGHGDAADELSELVFL
jgi:hypothetical protein